jgi:hypothetical protein
VLKVPFTLTAKRRSNSASSMREDDICTHSGGRSGDRDAAESQKVRFIYHLSDTLLHSRLRWPARYDPIHAYFEAMNVAIEKYLQLQRDGSCRASTENPNQWFST